MELELGVSKRSQYKVICSIDGHVVKQEVKSHDSVCCSSLRVHVLYRFRILVRGLLKQEEISLL